VSVRYQRAGPVAVVTIDRPERRNAIDRATALALQKAWRDFEEDTGALVGVLTGAGGVFCAGADLVALDLVEEPEGWLGFARTTASKPTIAAVAGPCVAGGLELALWCDLRVAGAEAFFGCFERRFGVPLADGGTQRLPRVVGLGRALDMILTGRAVYAEEALRIGLVDRLVPTGGELEAALSLAEAIAGFPQETLRSDRRAVYEGLGRPLAEGLELEAELARGVLGVAVEGAARFTSGEGRSGAGVMEAGPDSPP
jgi:enoyl-CoA hydratase